MNGRKLVAKPVGMAAGAAGGAAFNSLWRRVDSGRDVPEAEDRGRSWPAVLFAAALQGAVFAVIHALVQRATALPRTARASASEEEEGR